MEIDQLLIIRPYGEPDQLLLPEGQITNIGCHPDNQLVIASNEVDDFHAVLDHRKRPFTLLLLSTVGETYVHDQLLRTDLPYQLLNGDTIRLNGHSLVYIEGASLPDSPAQAVAQSNTHSGNLENNSQTLSETDADTLKIVPLIPTALPISAIPSSRIVSADAPSLDALKSKYESPLDEPDAIEDVAIKLEGPASRELWAAVNQPVSFACLLTNIGPLEAAFELEVWALDPSRVRVSGPQFVHLHANGDMRAIDFRFTALPTADNSANEPQHFALVARSQNYPRRQVTIWGTLRVLPFAAMDLEVQPSSFDLPLDRLHESTVAGLGHGKASVQFTNKGNQTREFQITASDRTDQLDFSWQIQGRKSHNKTSHRFPVKAGKSAKVRTQMKMRQPRIIGWWRRSHDIIFRAEVVGEPACIPLEATMQVYSYPMISAWIIVAAVLLFICSVLLLWPRLDGMPITAIPREKIIGRNYDISAGARPLTWLELRSDAGESYLLEPDPNAAASWFTPTILTRSVYGIAGRNTYTLTAHNWFADHLPILPSLLQTVAPKWSRNSEVFHLHFSDQCPVIGGFGIVSPQSINTATVTRWVDSLHISANAGATLAWRNVQCADRLLLRSADGEEELSRDQFNLGNKKVDKLQPGNNLFRLIAYDGPAVAASQVVTVTVVDAPKVSQFDVADLPDGRKRITWNAPTAATVVLAPPELLSNAILPGEAVVSFAPSTVTSGTVLIGYGLSTTLSYSNVVPCALMQADGWIPVIDREKEAELGRAGNERLITPDALPPSPLSRNGISAQITRDDVERCAILNLNEIRVTAKVQQLPRTILQTAGSFEFMPTASMIITLTAYGTDGSTTTEITRTVQVDAAPAEPQISFLGFSPWLGDTNNQVSPLDPRLKNLQITWRLAPGSFIPGTTKVELSSPVIGKLENLGEEGALAVPAGQSTLFILTARNGDKISQKSIKLDILPPPTAAPPTVPAQTPKIDWFLIDPIAGVTQASAVNNVDSITYKISSTTGFTISWKTSTTNKVLLAKETMGNAPITITVKAEGSLSYESTDQYATYTIFTLTASLDNSEIRRRITITDFKINGPFNVSAFTVNTLSSTQARLSDGRLQISPRWPYELPAETQSVQYEAEMLVDGEVVWSNYSADPNPQFVYTALPRIGNVCAVQVNVQILSTSGIRTRYRGNSVPFDCKALALPSELASGQPVVNTPIPLTIPQSDTEPMPTPVP